ncbi:fatty acid oxygenase [Fusarium oxysporum f. sp. phaseoli]
MLFYLATIIIHDFFRTSDDTKTVANPDFSISSTSSYLDLSPLYGNNFQEQEAVRNMKGGILKPDTFSEHRELERTNGSGRFGPNPRLSKEDAERKIDKNLFNTARLYCHMRPLRQYHLSDYTRTILNLNYAPESSWLLDPRESFSQVLDKVDFPVSTGNQVSVEFNLIYRGHSNVSAKDEKWSQDLF